MAPEGTQAEIATADTEVRPVLVVDLDGTVLRSDMLVESFWSALAQDWRSPFLATPALIQGRAALKARLADAARIDPATLPYNTAVLEHVRAWRAQGGRTALVTAAHGALAECVAAHLGLFDEVHGSDGHLNLKGSRKAAFLAERFGTEGYSYLGDAPADLPVWQGAAHAITFTPSMRLRRAVEALGGRTEHLPAPAPRVADYVRALRPHQWLKNLLVFVPVMTSHQIDAIILSAAFLAFVSFSLIASAVYVLNDLLDLAADRAHPRKHARPFASGAVSLLHGSFMVPALLLAGFLVALMLGSAFALVMLGYLVLTTAYSLDLKRRLVIDICVLAGLYTLRILAGSVATGIELSVWLLAFSIFFFLSLAAVKRQAELVDLRSVGGSQVQGRGYQVADLEFVVPMALAAGYASVLVMALYINSPEVRELYASPYALWGICPVLLYWISRIVMVTHRGHMHDDPVIFAIRDPISRITLVLVLGFALAGTLL